MGPLTSRLGAKATTSCVMFGQITPARLDSYERHTRSYHERYGRGCWAMLYQADVRARLELSERLRKLGKDERDAAVAAGGKHAFDPNMPWEGGTRWLGSSFLASGVGRAGPPYLGKVSDDFSGCRRRRRGELHERSCTSTLGRRWEEASRGCCQTALGG